MFGLALLWVAPASFYRPVALALLLQFFICETSYLWWKDFTPLSLYVPTDMMVLGVALWFRKDWTDLAIIAILPVAWYLYTWQETQTQWMLLYSGVVAQFVLAGPWSRLPAIIERFSEMRYGGNVLIFNGASYRDGA